MFVHVMARANLPAKKYKKSNPTQIRLSFEGMGSITTYIDIARALSAINRKFYRQGLYYYVNSVEIYNNEQSVFDIMTLPDTWVTKNAWNRGFQLFQKMNSMVDDPITNMGRPKYHDFKVYMTNEHRAAAQNGLTQHLNMLPYTHYPGATNAMVHGSLGEWDYSQFVSADSDGDIDGETIGQQADNFYVHMVGTHSGSSDNWTSVGLIKSYAESRVTVTPAEPNDQQVDNTDPLINIFDFSSEEQMNDIIDLLKTENDQPPYDLNSYVGEDVSTGGGLTQVARIGTEVGLGRVGKAAGFCAPMGLIAVDVSDADTAWRLVLNLAPGTYHGVYAERV